MWICSQRPGLTPGTEWKEIIMELAAGRNSCQFPSSRAGNPLSPQVLWNCCFLFLQHFLIHFCALSWISNLCLHHVLVVVITICTKPARHASVLVSTDPLKSCKDCSAAAALSNTYSLPRASLFKHTQFHFLAVDIARHVHTRPFRSTVTKIQLTTTHDY